MIQWGTVRPILIALFTELAVDQPDDSDEGDPENPPFEAEWKGRKNSATHAKLGKHLYLRVTSVSDLGEDETEYEEITEGENEGLLQETVSGQRKFVLQVQAHCLEDVDVDEDDGPVDDEWGIGVLDRVRAGLNLQSTKDRLNTSNLGLLDVSDIRDVSRVYDKREWSIATMDVTFAALGVYVNPESTGVIEHIELTGEATSGDEVLPSPPNVTDEWIPPLPDP